MQVSRLYRLQLATDPLNLFETGTSAIDVAQLLVALIRGLISTPRIRGIMKPARCLVDGSISSKLAGCFGFSIIDFPWRLSQFSTRTLDFTVLFNLIYVILSFPPCICVPVYLL